MPPAVESRSSCGAAASASRRKSETESVHCHCDARRREVRRRLRRKDELRRCAQALMQIRLMKALHVPRSYFCLARWVAVAGWVAALSRRIGRGLKCPLVTLSCSGALLWLSLGALLGS